MVVTAFGENFKQEDFEILCRKKFRVEIIKLFNKISRVFAYSFNNFTFII